MNTDFRKTRHDAPIGFFAAEAAGLRWLRVAHGPRIVDVRHVVDDMITLERIVPARPTVAAARRFGSELAVLHRCQADGFGSAPPGAPHHGYIGNAHLEYGNYSTFAPMFAELRLLPYVKEASDTGNLLGPERELLDRVVSALELSALDVGPSITPRRLHGDLWNGNVMWTDGPSGVHACLIDPAAYGGHPETDLAMLSLFGFPNWQEFIDVYAAELPLAAGWQERVALHQLYPLLVHVVLFGRGYVSQTLACAQDALRNLS